MVYGNNFIPGTWLDYNRPIANEDSTDQAYSGTTSRKFTAKYRPGDQDPQGILTPSFLLQEIGSGTAEYQLDFWVYPLTRNNVRVTTIQGSTRAVYNFTGLTENTWNRCTRLITLTENTDTQIAFHSGAQESGTWYIDDAVVRKLVCEGSSSSSCSSSSSS